MRKLTVFGLILALVLVMLCSCSGEKSDRTVQLYYLNMDLTRITAEEYTPVADTSLSLAEELLEKLQSEPDDSNLRQTIPSSVTVNGLSYNGYALVVDFDEAYYSMSMTEEVLTRAAIVKTLAQVNGYSSIIFTVDGSALVDAKGAQVGSMGADSFVENPGAQINSSIQTTLTLYFASADGMELVKETRSIHYSSNISLDKLVVEQLIEGPKDTTLQATIPSGTRPINISTVDGICYVNLDETFRNQNNEIAEKVVLYSIVNSLSELPDVDKVQISVNGDTTGKVRYDYALSDMYEADDSLLVGNSVTEPETEAATETETEVN
jgi:germination protein M